MGMFSHLDEVEMTRKYRKEHDLMGYEAEDLIDELDNVTEQDVMPFKYPENEEIEQVGVRGIYLNNYLRWDTRHQHEQMILKYDYEAASQTRTFDNYSDVDCWNYSDVHDFIKWLKHGYGKVLDHACREIRLRRLERSQAIELVKKYQNRDPKHLSLFLDWLGITHGAFQYIVDQHRNENFWERTSDWDWAMRHDLIESLMQSGDTKQNLDLISPFTEFDLSCPKKSSDNQAGYILIGKEGIRTIAV